ncbi:MAG: PKD domain-containing protein, partial [Bacteroidales bacterium]|nr:PKD domain-containing protein [Bacteroidales bacterium]
PEATSLGGFLSYISINQYESVTFTNASTNAHHISWNFDGGYPTTSTENVVTVTYAEAGSYFTATLTAYNEDETISDTKSIYVMVSEILAANFSTNPETSILSQSICINAGETVTYTNQSTAADHIAWTFEGGAPATSTANEVTVTYATAGTYTAILTAYNADESESDSKEVTIYVMAADFTTNPEANSILGITYVSINQYESVTFTNASTNAHHIAWEFEGGTPSTSTENIVTVAYNEMPSGLYFTATLTAYNEDESMSDSKIIYIYINPGEDLEIVEASFTTDPAYTDLYVSRTLSVEAGTTVTYTNTSTNADHIAWTFEGGAPATSTYGVVSVTYSTAGSYTTTLTAYNANESSSDEFSLLVTVTIASHTITAVPNNNAYGTVTGGGTYDNGTEITILASPYDGYRFVRWNDGVTDNPRSITVTGDATYTAYFEPFYTITASAGMGGSINPNGYVEVSEGESRSFTITANDGYRIVSVTVDGNESFSLLQNTVYILNTHLTEGVFSFSNIRANHTIVAIFETIPRYTISVFANNNAYGTVTGSGTYYEGSSVTIEAIPNDGYMFTSWNNGSTQNPRTVVVTEDANYVANFEVIPVQYTITVVSANDNQGSVAGGGAFNEGTVLQISATANAGFRFVSWNDNNTDNPRTITVTANATYIASFEALPPQYTVTVMSANETQGVVFGGGTYDAGTEIQISATANEGFLFASWNDGNTDNPRTITVTANATYIASFEEIPHYTITVRPSNPSFGITWGSGTYTVGTEITIGVEPNEGYRFIGWDDGETSSTRTIIVIENAIYTALLEEIPQYTITVRPSNPSFGTTWGGGTYTEGTEITIGVEPNEGYRFIGWDDGDTNSTRTIVVTENATYTAMLELIPPQYTITVLSVNPEYGLAFGGGTYERGTLVTISAEANEGYIFTSWNDNNTMNPRTIEVVADATYIASFADITTVNTYTITVLSANPEFGTVSGGGTYAEGTVITITAEPNDGYEFLQWNDGINRNPRMLNVTADATFIATFVRGNAVEETSVSDISLYPNPASDILNIMSTEEISEIEIVNVMGQVVYRTEVNACNAICDVEGLKAGMYVVRIHGTDTASICQRKFIKE